MRASLRILMGATAFAAFACEDGPSQIFTPLPEDSDPNVMNGQQPGGPFVDSCPPGDSSCKPNERSFGDIQAGDSLGRAEFCDKAKRDAQVKEMVVKPIVPDQSVGGVPLSGPNGEPLVADALLGTEPGQFCDPTAEYADAFTWGEENDVIILFNQETRIIELVIAYTKYQGKMEGTYTNAAGEKIPVVVQPGTRLKINGVDLDEYTGRAAQASRPRAWLNHANVTALYRMVRETFFGEAPLPDDFNCVARRLCDVQYTASNDSVPQDAFIILADSGVQIRWSPDGYAYFVGLEPVRVAPFESSAEISFFGAVNSSTTTFFLSQARDECKINIDGTIGWGDFKSKCFAASDDRAFNRANYDVYLARDAVDVVFSGIEFGFLRDTDRPPLRDGEKPQDSDRLYSVTFLRSLNAPVKEFVPRALAASYAEKLRARLRASIIASGSNTTPEQHPFYDYSIRIPSNPEFDRPTRIGELLYTTGIGRNTTEVEFVSALVKRVLDDYGRMSSELQGMLDPRIREELFLIEPYVEAVLDAFSYDASQGAKAFRAFRTTDDKRWSIGYANYRINGQAYRLVVQYKLDQRAVTAVTIERGETPVDLVFEGWRGATQVAEPYYTINPQFTGDGATPFGLDGDGIKVTSFDRQLDMLQVQLTLHTSTPQDPKVLETVVSGDPIQDENGFLRQIGGEKWEFTPANVVRLFGKETIQVFFVDAAGKIAAIEQRLFKGSVELCTGLAIRYGDDVPAKIDAFQAAQGSSAVVECDIAFNYSPNGNVLTSIASLTNKRAFDVVAGRAVTARIWR